jgi:hypothetical protein
MNYVATHYLISSSHYTLSSLGPSPVYSSAPSIHILVSYHILFLLETADKISFTCILNCRVLDRT